MLRVHVSLSMPRGQKELYLTPTGCYSAFFIYSLISLLYFCTTNVRKGGSQAGAVEELVGVFSIIHTQNSGKQYATFPQMSQRTKEEGGKIPPADPRSGNLRMCQSV